MQLVPPFTPAELGDAGGLAMVASALVLGVSGSLHCFLMCGPLACSVAPAGSPAGSVVQLGRKRAGSMAGALGAYHLARIASYSMVGGALGVFGAAFSRAFTMPLRSVLPWMMVAALLATVFDLGKRLAPLPGFANILRRAARAGASLSAARRAAIIGGITPLLPCGLLYGVFAAAFTAGSFFGGAILLGSFAIGGAPALLLAQLPAGLGARLKGLPALALQKGVPLVAAVVIAVRAIQAARGQACH